MDITFYGSTLITFREVATSSDTLIYMQIYVLSSTLTQKYGRICVNDIGRNTSKKLVCDWLHFLSGESVTRFAGCGNFNILGRSRVQRLRRFSSIVSRHLTGRWLLWKLKICSRHRDALILNFDSKMAGWKRGVVFIFIDRHNSKF